MKEIEKQITEEMQDYVWQEKLKSQLDPDPQRLQIEFIIKKLAELQA